MSTSTVPCPDCKHAVPIAEFLAAATAYFPPLGTVRRTCPACATTVDFRIVAGAVELGYIYAAGTAHFAAMEDVPIAGLTVDAGPTVLTVSLDGNTWSIEK